MNLETLLSAGHTLADLGEPQRDLDSFAGDFRDVGDTLRDIAKGLDYACEQAEDIYSNRCELLAKRQLWNIHEAREMTREEIEACRTNDLMQARTTAWRNAQRALIELARVIKEIAP